MENQDATSTNHNPTAGDPLGGGAGEPGSDAPRLRDKSVLELLALADYHSEAAKSHNRNAARYLQAAMIRIGQLTSPEQEQVGLADLLMEVRRGQT